MTKITSDLGERLHRLPGPFLFVGSGVSRRYAKLPDWETLLRHFADEAGRPYEYYRGRANGDLPQIATLIAEEFYDVWWDEDRYESQRTSWATQVTDRGSVLKIAVAEHLMELYRGAKLTDHERKEFEAFKKTVVEGAITTNYDPVLSEVFPTFSRFVGQDQLLISDTFNIAEIYHIHGAADDPTSLVLTAADYEDFNARNAYLASKLMTVFVEHPVIFLGYSLSDSNIRSILTSLVKGLRGRSLEALKDKLIVVEWDASATADISDAFIQIDDIAVPIVRVVVPDFLELFEVLGKRIRPMPARLLRILKEQVFEIVKSGDPTGRLYASSEIDDASAATVDLVFGVGAKMTAVGVVGLNRFDIMDDVLKNPDHNLPPDKILDLIIAKASLPTYIPAFKYLAALNLLSDDGMPVSGTVKPRIFTRVDRVRQYLESAQVLRESDKTISDLEAEFGWEWIFNHAKELPRYTSDGPGIRDFLIDHRRDRSKTWSSTQYAKLAVTYDWMTYGQPTA